MNESTNVLTDFGSRRKVYEIAHCKVVVKSDPRDKKYMYMHCMLPFRPSFV